MIDIKDKNGNLRYSVEITDKCVYYKALMEEEYVLLSFDSDTIVPLAKGDYIDTEFGQFYIVTLDKPKRNANGGYAYEQKFHVGWERLRNRLTFYDRQKGSEKSWKMTQTPEYFLDIITGNIYDAGYGRYTYEIAASLTEMKLVEFDATNIIDALTAVAEAWETEWWISDKVIHLTKCEYGSAVSLQLDDTLSDIESDKSQDTSYVTRLYAFGSTRNLKKNYRKDETASTVVEGVVETRLKLPAGVPYVDAWENLQPEDVVEGVAIFDDIYPRREGKIASVTTKEYMDTIENEDGTTTKEKWNAFRFTDTGITFSADYVIEGEELRIVFQTGKLAGMDFAVTFNPDGLKETDSKCQVFEIVRNEDYGVALPTDDFKPSVGDTYVLYGYDTSFVADKLVSAAEEELHNAAIDYVAKASQDKSVYTCKTNPIRCAGYTENALGKMAYNPSDVIDLDVGQSVTLYDQNYFATGYRKSRIRSFEKRLDNKFDCTYTIGESSVYSNRDALQEQIDDLTYQSKEISNVYGTAIYLVKRYDNTAPTDSNAFSSKRALFEFLRKNVPDTATAPLRMAAGLTVEGGLAADSAELDEAEAGKLRATEATVDALAATRAEMAEASVGGGLSVGGAATFGAAAGSRDFAAGLAGGRGWRVGTDGAAEVDALTVRRFLEVPELRFNRVDVRLGDKWRAPGGGLIESVDTAARTCRLKLEEGELGAVRAGDICMGIYHSTVASENAAEDTDDSRMNRQIAGFATVYFTVTEVTGERNEAFTYQLRPRSERWPREAEPRAMMTFVVYGSFTDTDRQTSVYETRTYTRMLRGQNTWETGPANIAMQTGELSNLAVHGIRGMEGYSAYLNSVYFTGVIRQVDAEGEPVLTARDRGEWQAAEAPYDYYDRVSHGGRLWLCIAEEGTTDEPSEASAAWLLQVDSGGEGAAAVWVEVTSSAGVMFQGGVGRTELRATVRRAPSEDVTALVPSSRFSWERTGPDAEADALWNAAHRAVGPVIEVSGDDVARQATFQCLVALDGLAI